MQKVVVDDILIYQNNYFIGGKDTAQNIDASFSISYSKIINVNDQSIVSEKCSGDIIKQHNNFIIVSNGNIDKISISAEYSKVLDESNRYYIKSFLGPVNGITYKVIE